MQVYAVIAFAIWTPCSAQVMVGSTPTYSNGWTEVALERHKKSKEELLQILFAAPDPNDRVGSAAVLFKRFPETRPAVVNQMKADADLDVRRRIATVLATQARDPEAIALLESHFKGPFDLSLEGSADLYLNLAYKLTALSGRSRGVDGALQILAAPTTWFRDAEARYPGRGEIRIDGLRTMAASQLSTRPEMKGSAAFRAALKSYCDAVVEKIRTSSADRKHWEGRLLSLLDVAIRSDLKDLARSYETSLDLIKDEYAKLRADRMRRKLRKRGDGRAEPNHALDRPAANEE